MSFWENDVDHLGWPAKPPRTFKATSMVGSERQGRGRSREPYNPGSDVTVGEMRDLQRKLRKL